MTHTPLTKAERGSILADCFATGYYAHEISRLCADLDAAEALHNSVMVDLAACVCRAEESDARVRNGEGAVRDVIAQRDRAESERDSERNLRVEAEAAATRAEAESATFSRRLAEALVRNDEDDLGCDRARMEEMRDERDALKAKLADPRRVVIHETEVVATKEEIATLKARLADLSEADEELHTCRALVNATSENLSVDLERMVDDLAEANEKAARSEKDSHSWHDLYEDTKAKLAALANAAEVVAENYEECAGFGELDCLAPLYAAIAAARGGAT